MNQNLRIENFENTNRTVMFGHVVTLLSVLLVATAVGCAEHSRKSCDSFKKTDGAQLSPGLFKRVFTIVFENEDVSQVEAQPYFNELSNRGARLSQFCALSYDSQPNYIAMTAGSTLDFEGNEIKDISEESIVDLVERKGMTWKVYVEGFPGNCFKGSRSGEYRRRHNPFISFENIHDSSSRCDNIVNASELEGDVDTDILPEYSFYIPDMKNGGHNTSIEYAAKWFQAKFEPLFENPNFMKDTLVIVTFDEGTEKGKNRIYTTLLGDMIQPGAVIKTSYTFYNLLKTIQDVFVLDTLNQNDKKAAPIFGVWK